MRTTIDPQSAADKPALTVAEVAGLTGFSRRTVTRLFQGERGVIILGRPETLHKRRYRSIRIPRAVYERVISRLIV
jgi:transcriptional regulator GlxA family with amidase domain